jgi:hypothetical protein
MYWITGWISNDNQGGFPAPPWAGLKQVNHFTAKPPDIRRVAR